MYNSTFLRNKAYYGGVFYSHYNTFISFDNCTFKENFAIRGSIGSADNNGFFTINNSTISENSAFISAIAHIVECPDKMTTINNTIIRNNYF